MILPLLPASWSAMLHVLPLMLTWLGAAAAFSTTDTNPINLVVNQATGGFKLDVPNSTLSFNSAEIFFQVSGKLYSTADGSLKKTNVTDGLGTDTLGKYQYKSILWQAGGARVETYYRYYTGVPVVLFGQHFPDGANGTSVGNQDHTCTGFPTLELEGQAGLLGYLSFGGNMFGGANIRAGEWYYQAEGIRSGITGGPLAVFDRDLNTVVLSPFSEFMAASVWHNGTGDGSYGGAVNYGIMGEVANIPPNFDYQTILFYGKGINQALHEWGGTLMRQYGKTRARTESDFASNYIGYWTDNGAYYYYNTEPGKNYEDTMVDVMAYAKEVGIPYRYLQLDSWWYYKGVSGGVKTWDARPDVFPSGLRALYEKIGLPIVAHNRYWAKDTTYAKQNGGNYSFIVEKQLAIPTDMMFWDDLFTQSSEWGLIVYEQDWLDVEFKGLQAILSSTSLGKQWLMQFGQAASSHDLNIQYCMANPRHALQSVQIPAVTQARVSSDYHPGNEQWRIGIGSIMAHALGVRPYKDTFWSTSNQTGSPYGHATEPYPRLQAAVATLSAGPVGPSDMVKGADVKLIMRSCNAEGLLLKPSRPATAIDLQIVQKAFQLDDGPKGEVWTTYSDISGLRFGIILAADLQADWNINAVTAGFGEMMPGMAFTWPPSDDNPFTPFGTADESLPLKQCGKSDFVVWYTSPYLILSNQTVLIVGETDKWVPMSPQRVTNILTYDSNVLLSLKGAPGETVTMIFWVGAEGLVEIKCVLNEAGTATLNVNKETCY